MPFYRSPDGQGSLHVNFGRKKNVPVPCIGPAKPGDNRSYGSRCFRMHTKRCDAPAGFDLGGTPLTCDAPICDDHATHVDPDVDYCPHHAHLATRVGP